MLTAFSPAIVTRRKVVDYFTLTSRRKLPSLADGLHGSDKRASF